MCGGGTDAMGFIENEAKMPFKEAEWLGHDALPRLGTAIGDVFQGDWSDIGHQFSSAYKDHNAMHARATTDLNKNNWMAKHPDATAAAVVGTIFGSEAWGGAADAGAGAADAGAGAADAGAGAADAGAGAADAGAGAADAGGLTAEDIALTPDIGTSAIPADVGSSAADVSQFQGVNQGIQTTNANNWLNSLSQYGKTAKTYAPLVQGVYQMMNAQQAKKASQQAQERAQNERQPYVNQLQSLMSNPGQVLPNTPGYQAGLQAVQRAQAAQGYQGSGNMMTALQQYGGNVYNQQAAMLSQLAGRPYDPNGENALARNQYTQNMMNQGLWNVGRGVSGG